MENGETFRGKALNVYYSLYMMSGAEGQLYWIDINDYEIMNDKPFVKHVRLGINFWNVLY